MYAKNHPDVSFREPIMLPSRHGQSEPDLNYLSFSHQHPHPSISNTFYTRNSTNDTRPGKRERKPGNRHYMWHEKTKQNLTESQTHNTEMSYAFQPRWGCGWLLAGHVEIRPEQTGGTCSQKRTTSPEGQTSDNKNQAENLAKYKTSLPRFQKLPSLALSDDNKAIS